MTGSGRNVSPPGLEEVGTEKGATGYFLKLENLMLIPLGCRLPMWNARCCSSGLFIASVEKAKHRKVDMGMGRGVKMVRNREFQQAFVDRNQMFSETVA